MPAADCHRLVVDLIHSYAQLQQLHTAEQIKAQKLWPKQTGDVKVIDKIE